MFMRANTPVRAGLRRLATPAIALALMGLPLHAAPLLDPAPLAAAEARQLSVDEIIARHYEAIGGDRHQSIKTMKTTGRSLGMGMEAPYTRYSKRPNKVLLEIYVQGMTGVQAFDGENAWWYMPFMGHQAAAPMPEEMALSMVEGADFDGPLIHARDKGHTVELVGMAAVNDRDAYELQLTLATGGTQTHWIDAETFLVTRVVSASGEATFSDYRTIGGHPVPSVITMVGPYGEQVVYIDEVEFDVEIDDAAFRMQQ